MKQIKVFFAGTLSQLTKKLSMEFNEGDEIKTIYDLLKKIDEQYDNRFLPEISKNFNLILEKDNAPPQLVPVDNIGEISLGKNNVIKFFYRFTGG